MTAIKEEKPEWDNISETEIEGIKAGLADIDAGRVHSHADVMDYISKKLDAARNSKKTDNT